MTSMTRRSGAACLLLAALIWAVAGLLGPGASLGAGSRKAYARLHRACPPPSRDAAGCLAVVRIPAAATEAGAKGVHAYTVGAGAAEAGLAGGLTPQQLATAYGYEPASGGSGQTVAIVDAYDAPSIEADLNAFDEHYKLGSCTKENGCFQKVNQAGAASPLPPADAEGWSEETALDAEIVRAACESCKILLIEAQSPSYKNLARAVKTAGELKATEISNSYGGPEEGLGSEERKAYEQPGVVITAASGDDGYEGWDWVNEELPPYETPEMPDAPASLPSVVSVGGTTLTLNEDGTRAGETVWNDNGPGDELNFPSGFVSGGGCSLRFTANPWQSQAAGFPAGDCGAGRLNVDISADGDPFSGFDILDTYNFCLVAHTAKECKAITEGFKAHKGWQTFGGTSLGSPLIASLYALAGGGAGVTYPALTLYGHLGEASSLRDVTTGGNGFCDAQVAALCGNPNTLYEALVDCEGTTACNAAHGFDGPSGVGTPVGLGAFKPRLPVAAISPVGALERGIPASFSGSGSTDPYPGGSISNYIWQWGDETSSETHSASTSHTYAHSGHYTVTLRVTDSYGLTSAATTREVQVAEPSVEEEELAKKHKEEEAAARKRQEEEARQRASLLEVAGFKSSSPPPKPNARIAGTTVKVGVSGRVTLRITCPAGETACIGRVTLRRGTAKLGSAPFIVPGGKARFVTFHLSAAALRLLAIHHPLRVTAKVLAHDRAGAAHTTLETLTLRK